MRATSLVSAPRSDPTLIEAKLADLRRTDPTAADLASVDRRIAEVEAKRRRYLTDLDDEDRPSVRGVLRDRLAMLDAEAERLAGEHDGITARQAAWQRERAKLDDLMTWCRTVGERLTQATYQVERDALEYLGVRVKIYRQDAPERFVVEAVTITPEGEIVSTLTCPGGRRCAPSGIRRVWRF